MKYLVILTYLSLLGFLFIGIPLEFFNLLLDRVFTSIVCVLVLVIFLFLYQHFIRIPHRFIRIPGLVLLVLLAIPYAIHGLIVIPLLFSRKPPMWQDLRLFTNDNGEKVIEQFRETNGSLHDVRYRMILADFKDFRVSYNFKPDTLKVFRFEKELIEINKIE